MSDKEDHLAADDPGERMDSSADRTSTGETLGSVRPWSQGMDFKIYLSRVEMYMKANKVADDLKVPTFLTIIGEQAFELLMTLVHPKDPTEMTYEEIRLELKKHLAPEPSLATERYKFQCCRQKPGQSVSEFIVELQKCASTCKFNEPSSDYRKDRLCDQLIFGLSDERLRSKVLAERGVTFDLAVEWLRATEVAASDSKVMSQREVQVAKIQKASQKVSSKPIICHRCGSNSHASNDCRFKNATCFHCRKTGHIASVCRAKQTSKSHGSRLNADKRNRVHSFQETDEPYWIKTAKSCRQRISRASEGTLHLSCIVEGKALAMELDTGCSQSLIPKDVYNRMFSHVPMQASTKILRTYTNGRVQVLGEINVLVSHNNTSKLLPLIIVDSG